tara:strand:+ start:745 stop:1287 length:543 start_codon:yes stop_codon:yes gene_type:complete
MATFEDIASLDGFSIKKLNIDDIKKVELMMPSNGIVDINIAERGIVATLEGQNLCQEKLVKVERWIGLMESKKSKAWSKAALDDAPKLGHKTGKDKEWYASSDEDYLKYQNEIVLSKACKKWLENKASYFSSWHYAFKTFLGRDYLLEKSAKVSNYGYTNDVGESPLGSADENMCGEIDW